MARLFIALELPEDVKDELVRIQDVLRSRFGRSLRFPPRENLHLTQNFSVTHRMNRSQCYGRRLPKLRVPPIHSLSDSRNAARFPRAAG